MALWTRSTPSTEVMVGYMPKCFAECSVQPHHQGGEGGVIIWAGISIRGKTDMVFVEGNMNTQHYAPSHCSAIYIRHIISLSWMIMLDHIQKQLWMLSSNNYRYPAWISGQHTAHTSTPLNIAGISWVGWSDREYSLVTH